MGEGGKETVEPPKGFLFGLDLGSVDVTTYASKLDYLLVQPEGYSDVFGYKGKISFAEKPWTSYCQWHDGPLDEADDPTRRLYCPVPADTFCSKHRRTERAAYTLCLDSRSEKALDACKYIDSIVKTEYVVYMVDYGGDKPKVGTTRKFRLLERISEQPHIVATVIYETDSLFDARRAEMKVSREGIAVESWRHKIVFHQDLYFGITRLKGPAEKASRLLGFQWPATFFTIKLPLNERPLVVEPDQLGRESYDVIGAWGGFLFLKNSRGQTLAIKTSYLMHKNSLMVDLRTKS